MSVDIFAEFEYPETLDERQKLAIEFLSQPERGGLTFDQIAERCGVSVRTLHRWRTRQDFKDAVCAKAFSNIKYALPDVISANICKAKQGSAKHIELLYKLAGLLIDRSEVKTQEVKRDNEAIERDINKLTHLLNEKKKDEEDLIN